MSERRCALVVGGSMSGLLVALMLHRRGWDVDVFERVETELASRGAGILARRSLSPTLARSASMCATLASRSTRARCSMPRAT